jgi:energy-coupling factor transporter ATP-binding protein EcfA2
MQLLCLARAVARDAAILILDESNASVDSATDEIMEDLVQRFIGGEARLSQRRRTLIQISHRATGLQSRDMVMVGARAEIGPCHPASSYPSCAARPQAPRIPCHSRNSSRSTGRARCIVPVIAVAWLTARVRCTPPTTPPPPTPPSPPPHPTDPLLCPQVMQAGQLVEVGPPAELLQLPQGHFSAMMNALEKAKEGDEGEGKGQ